MKDPGLNLSQFNAYFADFPHLRATHKEDKSGNFLHKLKRVRMKKTPIINGLLYKVYLSVLYTFVFLLALIYNKWMKQENISQCFTRCLMKLLDKNKHTRKILIIFCP